MTKISCGIIIGALILGLGISINRQSVNSKINDEKSEYLSVTNEDGIVYIKMLGHCSECPLIDTTLKDSIEVAIINEVPEVVEVRNINE